MHDVMKAFHLRKGRFAALVDGDKHNFKVVMSSGFAECYLIYNRQLLAIAALDGHRGSIAAFESSEMLASTDI